VCADRNQHLRSVYLCGITTLHLSDLLRGLHELPHAHVQCMNACWISPLCYVLRHIPALRTIAYGVRTCLQVVRALVQFARKCMTQMRQVARLIEFAGCFTHQSLQVLAVNGLHRVYVLDDTEHSVGIITLTDVLRQLLPEVRSCMLTHACCRPGMLSCASRCHFSPPALCMHAAPECSSSMKQWLQRRALHMLHSCMSQIR
jgi:hypothetical protein